MGYEKKRDKMIEWINKYEQRIPKTKIPIEDSDKKSPRKEIPIRGVNLDNLDGFEFEAIVGEIYGLHGYSVIDIQNVGDAGRDLILERHGKRILVECKHQKGTVGRPVIQKLHSAVMVDQKAEVGVVVTTGTFSRQAREYASNPQVPIQLMELPELRGLASEVNFKLLLKGEKMEKGYYPVKNRSETLENLISYIKQYNFQSHPYTLEDIFVPGDWTVELLPVYRVSYRIDHTTKTTVGNIYNAHESGVIHIDPKNLRQISTFDSFFDRIRPIDRPNQPRLAIAETLDVFHHDSARIAGISVDQLKSKYSQTVSYYGRNNVRYEKDCIPSSSDILIRGVTPIYLPLQKTPLIALRRKYDIEILENEMLHPKVLHSNFASCHICNSKLSKRTFLCNSCGNLSHGPSWWRRSSHSYNCDICGKTICRDCGYWTDRWVFMKRVICEECFDTKEEQGKSYEMIPQLQFS